ncbi:MAG TPA: xylulokinase [Clostridiaceae bacterium]|nr:xylulokinase [Clostridiaceae bacterium]
MSYLMGIDLGTSGVKALIMDLEGNIAGKGKADYGIQTPEIGYAEQDAGQLWNATVSSIKQALSDSSIDPSEIKSIGLSGQMHGLVIVDNKMQPIRPVIIWPDQRSKKQIDSIYSIAGRQRLRETTLNSLSTGFFLTSLMWIKENEPDNYRKIYKAILPKDYIKFKLCGVISTEATDASSTAAFNTAKRCWAFNLIEETGIDADYFPEIGESLKISGTVTKECAGQTGLCHGTPVIYGGGDTLMYSVGTGIIKPGIVSVNIGSGCQTATSVNEPLYDKEFRTNTFCHVKNDLWLIIGGHLNGGITLKWLKEKMFPNMSFADFDVRAKEINAGSDGVIFLPYLSGERTPYHDPSAKAILFGLTLGHNCNHIIRAAMEGVVMAMRLSLEIFRELNIPTEKIVASGGGARSDIWLKMQADIFDAEICRTTSCEEACTGAAIAAGVGAGIYNSIEEACSRIVRYSPEVTYPDKESVKVYNEAFERFKLLYCNNLNLFT